jgi:hypothetical protein
MFTKPHLVTLSQFVFFKFSFTDEGADAHGDNKRYSRDSEGKNE